MPEENAPDLSETAVEIAPSSTPLIVTGYLSSALVYGLFLGGYLLLNSIQGPSTGAMYLLAFTGGAALIGLVLIALLLLIWVPLTLVLPLALAGIALYRRTGLSSVIASFALSALFFLNLLVSAWALGR